MYWAKRAFWGQNGPVQANPKASHLTLLKLLLFYLNFSRQKFQAWFQPSIGQSRPILGIYWAKREFSVPNGPVCAHLDIWHFWSSYIHILTFHKRNYGPIGQSQPVKRFLAIYWTKQLLSGQMGRYLHINLHTWHCLNFSKQRFKPWL